MRQDKAILADLFRDNPSAIATYITEKFEKNDITEGRVALSLVMQAQNVQMLARDAGLRRDTLYKTFGGRVDPQLSRVLKLFDAMNVRALIKPSSVANGSEALAAQLCEGFADNDPGEAIRALNVAVKSQNVPALALALGIMRTTVYKTFGGRVDPQLGRVLNLLNVLQLRFVIVPRPSKIRPPRPKLGRPPKKGDRAD